MDFVRWLRDISFDRLLVGITEDGWHDGSPLDDAGEKRTERKMENCISNPNGTKSCRSTDRAELNDFRRTHCQRQLQKLGHQADSQVRPGTGFPGVAKKAPYAQIRSEKQWKRNEGEKAREWLYCCR